MKVFRDPLRVTQAVTNDRRGRLHSLCDAQTKMLLCRVGTTTSRRLSSSRYGRLWELMIDHRSLAQEHLAQVDGPKEVEFEVRLRASREAIRTVGLGLSCCIRWFQAIRVAPVVVASLPDDAASATLPAASRATLRSDAFRGRSDSFEEEPDERSCSEQVMVM